MTNVKVVSDLNTCKELWEKYTSQKNLWEDSEVIFNLFDKELYEPLFLVFEFGILPLWFDKEYATHYFFGGNFPERRELWLDQKKFEEVYNALPKKTKLFDINAENITFDYTKYDFEEDYRYFLDSSNFKSIEDFYATLGKKQRHNLKYDFKKLDSFNLKTEWSKTPNFEFFAKLNVERFKEESDVYTKKDQEDYLRFLDAIKKYLLVLEVYDDEKLVGTEFCAFYNNVLYVLNGAYLNNYSNLGKGLIIKCIEKGIDLNAKEIDFLVGDTGWKELWNLKKQKVVTIKKN